MELAVQVVGEHPAQETGISREAATKCIAAIRTAELLFCTATKCMPLPCSHQEALGLSTCFCLPLLTSQALIPVTFPSLGTIDCCHVAPVSFSLGKDSISLGKERENFRKKKPVFSSLEKKGRISEKNTQSPFLWEKKGKISGKYPASIYLGKERENSRKSPSLHCFGKRKGEFPKNSCRNPVPLSAYT